MQEHGEGCFALLKRQEAVFTVVLGPQVLFCLLRGTIFKITDNYWITIQVAIGCSFFPPSVESGEHPISWKGITELEMWGSKAWVPEVGVARRKHDKEEPLCSVGQIMSWLGCVGRVQDDNLEMYRLWPNAGKIRLP